LPGYKYAAPPGLRRDFAESDGIFDNSPAL